MTGPAPQVPLSRRGQVPPFHVMEVIKAANLRAQTHGDVISLCAGQPSTPAPAAVRHAAAVAIESDILGYTDTAGILALREAIAAHYAHRYDVEVSPDEVLVTTGSSGGLTALILAAFDVGDEVVLSRPGYPAYRNTLQALGCRVVELDCGPQQDYRLSVDMLEALPRPPAGVIVASPANPTGTVIGPADLARIARWCQAHGCLLISDEIYHGITFGAACTTAWQTSRDSAVVGSFSKYYSMTGWRLGWLLLPDPLRRRTELLLGNLNLCAPAVSQAAATAAFEASADAELQEHVARYRMNRDLLLDALPALGIHRLAPPDGAFYLYADVGHLTTDSRGWCTEVLDRTGVALTPGVDFAPPHPDGDPALDGSRFVRISFAASTEDLREALSRLAGLLSSG